MLKFMKVLTEIKLHNIIGSIYYLFPCFGCSDTHRGVWVRISVNSLACRCARGEKGRVIFGQLS